MPATKFWFVWNPANRAPRVKHRTKEAAQREAERLARANRGEEFIVLESLATVRLPEQPVEWSNHGQDEAEAVLCPCGCGQVVDAGWAEDDDDDIPF